MRGLPALILAAAAAAPFAAGCGVLLPDLDLRVRNEFHSAYISSSSGGIGETRPMLTQTIGGSYDFGEWGRAGGYAWARSALTGQKDEYRRRAFECFEYGVEWSRRWQLAKELGLYTYFDHLWSPSPGWRDRGKTLQAVVIEQALDNPWATPYYRFLGAWFPNQWETLKIGVRQPFRPFDGVVVTPYAEMIGGDNRRYRSKYGDESFDTYCSIGMFASEIGASIAYKVSEFISTRLRLRNWNLLDRSARRHEKHSEGSWHVCWLPAVTFAVDVTF